MDFSTARPADPQWRRWLSGRLDLVEARKLEQVYDTKLRQNLAAMARVDPKGVKTHWDRANEFFEKSFRLKFPWLGGGEKAEGGEEDYARMWADAFGDPDDPETQRKIDEAVRSLAAR